MKLTMSDGAEIYVDYRNRNKNQTILIIHGGPGESCITFEGFSLFLEEAFNIVLVDQRGVLRSCDRMHESSVSLNIIIEDFEFIRQKLNIERWILYGHSFGGLIVMLYQNLYPESISGVILENPTINLSSSCDNVLRIYERLKGEVPHLLQYKVKDDSIFGRPLIERLEYMLKIPAKDRQRIFHNELISEADGCLFSYPGYSREEVQSCGRAAVQLLDDPAIRMDGREVIRRGLHYPVLLLRDERDPLLAEDEFEFLCKYVICRQYPSGGHYLHLTRKAEIASVIMEIFDEKEY